MSRPLVPALLALYASCGGVSVEEIALRLTSSDESACGRALFKGNDPQSKLGVWGVHLLMVRRVSNQMYSKCVNTWGTAETFARLQTTLQTEVTFLNVQEGSWDLWLVGSNQPCALPMTETRLCGKALIAIPPPSSVLAVPVTCEDPFSDQATLEAMKRQISQCKLGMPPLPRP